MRFEKAGAPGAADKKAAGDATIAALEAAGGAAAPSSAAAAASPEEASGGAAASSSGAAAGSPAFAGPAARSPTFAAASSATASASAAFVDVSSSDSDVAEVLGFTDARPAASASSAAAAAAPSSAASGAAASASAATAVVVSVESVVVDRRDKDDVTLTPDLFANYSRTLRIHSRRLDPDAPALGARQRKSAHSVRENAPRLPLPPEGDPAPLPPEGDPAPYSDPEHEWPPRPWIDHRPPDPPDGERTFWWPPTTELAEEGAGARDMWEECWAHWHKRDESLTDDCRPEWSRWPRWSLPTERWSRWDRVTDRRPQGSKWSGRRGR